MRKSFVWIASLFLFFAAQGAFAATYTFTGAFGDDWAEINCWETAGGPAIMLPSSTDDIIVNGVINSNTSGSEPVVRSLVANAHILINITVTNSAVFNTGSSFGSSTSIIFTGNPVFNNANNSGTINGNPTFNGSSVDDGTINGNPTFNDSSHGGLFGFGQINGDPIYNDSSYLDSAGIIHGNPTFNDLSYTVAGSQIIGNAIFNGTINRSTITGSPVFNGTAENNGAGVINGNPVFNGNSINKSIYVTGNPIFTGSSSNHSLGTITGSPKFYDLSLNSGRILGNPEFYDSSNNYNSGIITGSPVFNGRSLNIGVITGISTSFNNSSINAPTGVVNGAAFLSCDAGNSGTINGLITNETNCDSILYWHNSGINNNWDTLTGNWWTDPFYVNQSSTIPTHLSPVVILSGTGPSINIDSWVPPFSFDVSAGNVSFVSSSLTGQLFSLSVNGNATFNGTINYSGTVTGNATFNDSSKLSGGNVTGNATFNGGSSYNDGTVTGNAIYSNAVAGVMTVPNNSRWSCGTAASNKSSDTTTTITSWIFNGNSTSCGVLNGSAIFNNTSTNNATVTGNATFNGSSYNSASGIVQGNVTWNSDKFGTIPTGNTLTLDQNDWSGIINGIIFASNGTTPISNFVFNDTTSTYSSGTNIKANVILNDTSYIKNTPVTGNITYNTTYFGPLPTAGTMTINTGASYDQNKFTHGVVSGTTYGSDSLPITHYVFNNSSGLSQAATITGSAEFNDSTFHLGTINGNVTFNDTSTSSHSFVNGDAIFRECSVNVSTSVSGTAQDLRSCGGSGGKFTPQSDFSLPIISDFSLSPSTNSAVITFNTNEPTKNIFTFIDFTLSDTGLNPFINLPESTQKMQHSVTLSNLKSCTTYKYYFVVKDVVGNTTRYGDGNDKLFTTLGCPNDPVQPLVEPPVKPEPNITSLTATPTVSDSTISFSTPTPTTAVITYGTTTDYGTTTTTHPFGTSHIFLLTPLDACTTYHYVIGTKDADDVVTTSADHTFKTLGCPVGDVDEPAQEEKELPPVVNPPVVQGEDGPADNNGENNNNNDAVIVGGGNVGRGGGVAAGGNSGAGNNFVKAPDAGADLVVLLESVVQPLSPDSPPDISPFAVSSSLASSIVPGNTNGASDLGDKGTSDTSTSSVAGETVKFFNSVKHSVQKNTRQTLVNTLGEKNTEVLSKTIAKTVEETVVVSKYTLIGASALLAVLFIALNIMLFQGLWTTYLVERGETIASLCNKFSMSEETLRKKNPHLFETTTNLDGTLSTPLTSESLVPEGISLKVRNRHYIERDYLNQLQYVLKNFMESRKSELVS